MKTLDRRGRKTVSLKPMPMADKVTRIAITPPKEAPICNAAMPNAPLGYAWLHTRTPPRG